MAIQSFASSTWDAVGCIINAQEAAGLDIVYVPFKGTPETVNGLLTGSVELIYAANQIVAPLSASGQVRALAKLDRDGVGGELRVGHRAIMPPSRNAGAGAMLRA